MQKQNSNTEFHPYLLFGIVMSVLIILTSFYNFFIVVDSLNRLNDKTLLLTSFNEVVVAGVTLSSLVILGLFSLLIGVFLLVSFLEDIIIYRRTITESKKVYKRRV